MPRNDRDQLVWFIAQKTQMPEHILPIWQRWARRRSQAQLWGFILGLEKPNYKTRYEMESKRRKLSG